MGWNWLKALLYFIYNSWKLKIPTTRSNIEFIILGGGGGGRFGGNRGDQGPPARVIPFGHFEYPCQDDLVLKAEIEDVPYFNAPIYLENKSQIGKIDEIFGTLRDYSVSVKLGDNMKVNSFAPKQKVIESFQKCALLCD